MDSPSPLRAQIPLQRRKVLKKSFASLTKVFAFIGIGSMLLYAGLYGDVFAIPEWAEQNKILVVLGWILFVFLLILSRMLYQILYFITYYYDMDENNVVIRKGVFTKREITLPFSKITDVYVDQDMWDLVLGLYDVHISTPTVESGVFAHIDGVNKKGSVQLRKMVLDAVNRSTK